MENIPSRSNEHESDPSEDNHELFSRFFLANQSRVFGFILTLVRDRSDARDILQETSVVLWRKFDRFEPGTDFAMWAMSTARLCVFEWRRKQKKLPLPMDDKIFDLLADEAVVISCEFEARREALRSCLSVLPEQDTSLLVQRYDLDQSVAKIGQLLNRSRIAIYKRLMRIQRDLLQCVQKKVALEGGMES
tara:strand:- start:2368 stop:2940 length:573 start_codon:yes stop_codon:yes gene_type:complete